MPTTIIGIDAIEKLSDCFSSFSPKKIFLVTGKKSFSKSGAQKVIKRHFPRENITIFDNFSVNPKLEEALPGCKIFKESNCDMIIAVGGGSTIDMAKMINAVQTCPERAEEIATGKLSLTPPLTPFIAIPTTAGTGSESTHFAAIYVKGNKYSLAHPELIPDVAIIDPNLSLSSSAYLTACTGFDALCQAVESFWAVGSTEESREYSREAIAIILQSLPNSIESPKDIGCRLTLAKAANLAGKAINISKTTAPHAISYPLTSYFKIPHGHAAALTLGKFFIINDTDRQELIVDPRGPEHLGRIKQELAQLFQAESMSHCRTIWYEIMESCGLETNPVNLGVVSQKDVSNIVSDINMERLANHPVKLSNKQVEQLFMG